MDVEVVPTAWLLRLILSEQGCTDISLISICGER